MQRREPTRLRTAAPSSRRRSGAGGGGVPNRAPKGRRAGRDGGATGSWMWLMYGVSLMLSLGLLWVLWPLMVKGSSSSDHERAARQLERENPDAEVLQLPLNVP